jgi:hypothetical protein
MLEILKIRKDINWLIEQIKCLIRKSDLDCPLAATEWSPNHSVALGNPYILDCFVWFEGHVYKSLIEDNQYPPTNDCYWEDLGEGHLLLEEQSNWNATTGRAFIRNKPDLSQYALDANVVHKTGNETIDGAKTFNNSQIFIKNAGNTTIGSIYKSGNGWRFLNSSTLNSFSVEGGILFLFKTTTSIYSRIDTSFLTAIRTHNLPDASGTIALDENLVHKTGDETIDGIKTFVKDIIVNDIFVGRGEGGHNTNTALGYRVLLHNTTGVENTAIGSQALRNNIIGIRNTAVGEGALKQNLVDENTAVGHGSLQVNTSGAENTAVGALALNSNIIGSGNTAVGIKTLKDNVASNNTAIGKEALSENKLGYDNTAIGVTALKENINGFDNVAIGIDALRKATNGTQNTAVGKMAMGDTNIAGNSNTALGVSALERAYASTGNTGVGVFALYNVRGDFNTAVGYGALNSVGLGKHNVAVGASALAGNQDGDNNVAIGYNAFNQENFGSDNIGIGRDCRIIGKGADNSIVIGADARGLGSNTTVIGNNFTTLTELRGDLSLPEVRNLNFIDDAAAALGGVPIDAIYHNAGILRIRLV